MIIDQGNQGKGPKGGIAERQYRDTPSHFSPKTTKNYQGPTKNHS